LAAVEQREAVGTIESTDMVALNADVVGYSKLMADDFARTTATMTQYHRLVEERVGGGHGVLANFVGDSFMAVFDRPTQALHTAIAIATATEDANRNLPESQWARFRMGIDQGQVAVSGGQYHGDPLNIAARIQAIAPPGGLSVSGRVYQALDEPQLRFRPTGRQHLKNIPEHIQVYQFVDLPHSGAAQSVRSSLSLETPTIAVLPMHTEAVDRDARATAEMVRMDLLHRLARVPQLNVIDAGSEPGVQHGNAAARYMLEGGVHQLGDEIRLYTTLFDVTTMNIVKAHKWTASNDQLMARSDEIADEVARAVEVELIIGEPAGLYAELGDPEAIENVYLGWYHFGAGTPEEWTRAVELFGKVADAHPDKPFGHALLAYANWTGASAEWVPDPAATMELAAEQARTAMAVGDPTGLGQTVEAAVLLSRGEPAAALAAMDRLEIVRPTCDVAYGLGGSVRRYLGDWQQAVDLTDVAMRLTARNKPWYPTVKACSLYVGGHAEDAAAIAESVLEFQPNNLEALLVLAAAQSALGMDRRARATAELVKERFPAVDVEAWLAKNPYQDPETVQRWEADLAAAGAIG
jgi:adenylate cyclase